MTWKAKIENAKEKGYFTKIDKDDAKMWPFCAVGEKCKITLSDTSVDLPEKIHDLGITFCQAVLMDDIKSAERLYKRIQRVKYEK